MVQHAQTHEWQRVPNADWRKDAAKTAVTPLRFRTLFPSRKYVTLADQCLAALFPWRRAEYPGVVRLRGWLMGVDPRTALEYRKRKPLPWSTARTMAGHLEAKASELLRLAAECRAYADQSSQGAAAKARASKRAVVLPPE